MIALNTTVTRPTVAGIYTDFGIPGTYSLAPTDVPAKYRLTLTGSLANDIRAAIAQTYLGLESAVLANAMAKLDIYKLLEDSLPKVGISWETMWVTDDWKIKKTNRRHNGTEAEILVHIA